MQAMALASEPTKRLTTPRGYCKRTMQQCRLLMQPCASRYRIVYAAMKAECWISQQALVPDSLMLCLSRLRFRLRPGRRFRSCWHALAAKAGGPKDAMAWYSIRKRCGSFLEGLGRLCTTHTAHMLGQGLTLVCTHPIIFGKRIVGLCTLSARAQFCLARLGQDAVAGLTSPRYVPAS